MDPVSYHTCQVCSSVFNCLAKYQQHRKEHAQAENVKLFTCPACDYVSDSEFNFNWHRMSHGTTMREHRCAICSPSQGGWNNWNNSNEPVKTEISADELRWGKRSIATQYCDEDVDPNAKHYILQSSEGEEEENGDDEETEEEEGEEVFNGQADEQETDVEDDAATQIEEYADDNYVTNDNYDNDDDQEQYFEQEGVYQNGHDADDLEKTEEEDDPSDNQSFAQSQKHLNNNHHQHHRHNNHHNNYNENYSFSSTNKKSKKASKKATSKRKNGKVPGSKSISSGENTDIYDFRSDDDAHFETTKTPKTPSRSSSISLAPGTPTAQAPTHLAPGSQTIQTNAQLLQPATSTTAAFLHHPHPHAHLQHPTHIPHHSGGPEAFPMPQQAFFTLPHPQAGGGPFQGPPGAQQFIHNHQFTGQPGGPGQIQLLSIPTNMQNGQFLTQPPQQPQPQQLSHLPQPGPQLSAPEMNGECPPAGPIKKSSTTPIVKAKKSKLKHAVLLPTPNNQQHSDEEDAETEEGSTPSSPVKPKGHGKGNRKPRINFVSLGNGITIGSDGIRRKFHCSLCGNGKSFKTKSHLQRHMLTHTGEKPYQCNDCGSKFNQSSSLRNHMIAIHTKQFPHMCTVCGKGFLMPAVLAKHIQQTGHTGDDQESCQENSNGSNGISNENVMSTFNNIMQAPVRTDGYYPQAFNAPSNVMMTYAYTGPS